MNGRAVLVAGLIGAAALFAWSRRRQGAPLAAGSARGEPGAIDVADELVTIPMGDWQPAPMPTVTAPPEDPSWLDRISMGIGDMVDTIKAAFTPRGIRNNNPGNLRPSGDKWLGQVGTDGGYLQFDTAANGLRALARNLFTYYRQHDLNTVAGIIGRWAPQSENDTGAYVAAVARALGVKPTDKLDVPRRMPALVAAITLHENGVQPYSAALIADSVRRAA